MKLLRRNSFLFLMIISSISLTAALVDHDEFPRIITSSYNHSANLSETTILTCHVVNLGYHHVTWLKYDSQTFTYLPLSVGEQVFLSDKRYFVSSRSLPTGDSYWNLEISHVKLADEGTYECKIANRHASVSIQINLTVQIPMSIQPARLAVEPGSSVELDCTIYNLNTSSITWHFSSADRTYAYENYQDEIDERYLVENNLSKSQLIIHHAQPHHSGLWTCSYKRQRRSAKLFVQKGVAERLVASDLSLLSVTKLIYLIYWVLHSIV